MLQQAAHSSFLNYLTTMKQTSFALWIITFTVPLMLFQTKKKSVCILFLFDNPLSNKNNLTVTDLLTKPFILTEKGMSYRRLLDEKLASKSIEINPTLEIGRADLICRLVEKIWGFPFCPIM